ncbi:hypothetical protein [Trinickia dinghuensis]|uniref:ABM domain-containing protein n=1 Tax=Trinickia dinghuensis TaxID=2291023 RepID=A0A3D8JV71_9BURK|nr:hypothetical protein [Trinickia dinghuensis]RDU96692.1 hypothetical protein DWV00_22080 [Trinickia dinghuensis]
MENHVLQDGAPASSSPVVRVSLANFDPARFTEVNQMAEDIGEYLIPAIKKLPGLIHYYAACSPKGSMIHVSIWDTDEHAQQMSHLKEMIVDAKNDAEKVGVVFTPIVHYPTNWKIIIPQ